MSADRPMIEVPKPLHAELKATAAKHDARMSHMTAALLRYGLDDLKKGFVDIEPIKIKPTALKPKKTKKKP
jgi:hypothetical protein